MRTKIFLALFCLLSLPALADPSRVIFEYTNSLVASDRQLILDGTAVDATMTGWYDATGLHMAANPNYIAGFCSSSDTCSGDNQYHRDFFVFDVPSGAYSTATLRLMNPPNALNNFPGYLSPFPTELFVLHDVTSALDELMSSQTGRVDIYDDLGAGLLYGTRVVSGADNATVVEISLNAGALAAINRAAGGQWAAGGSLDLASGVPEPATLSVVAAGLLALFALRRRFA